MKKCKFKIGDEVIRDDNSNKGIVTFIGSYDETIDGYRIKVLQKNGQVIYWNESSTKLKDKK